MKETIIFLSLIVVVFTTSVLSVYAEEDNFTIYSKKKIEVQAELPVSNLGIYKAQSPGGRPGIGEGIGQEGTPPVPIGDGYWIIILATIFYVTTIAIRKRNAAKTCESGLVA